MPDRLVKSAGRTDWNAIPADGWSVRYTAAEQAGGGVIS